MRNIIYIILTSIFLLVSRPGSAQCPLPIFTVNDTVCPLQSLNIDNSLSMSTGFNWDFCLGDLDSLPVGIALPSVPVTLNYPQNMKLVEENGEYFLFLPNGGTNYITRYDFGNSLNNIPSVANLNGDPLLGTFASGIDLVKEGSKWYGFVTTYANQLIRLEFDSIRQINPIITNMNVSSLAGPNGIRVTGGYAFIPNNQTAEIIRFDFNGSYANTPTLMSPSINTALLNNFSIDIAFDCSSGKYIGYTSSLFSGGIISKLDFGNSLSNTPTFTNVLTSLGFALGVQLVEEKNNWHLFFISGNTFNHYKIGESLDLNNPIFDYTTNFTNLLATPANLQIARQGTDWTGFVSNTNGWNVIKANFPQGCPGPVQSSTIQSPNGINFPSSLNESYQYLELTEKDSSGNYTNYLDSVYVIIPPPKASFFSSPACKDAPTLFIDSSTVCYGSINSWYWDFGDGNNSIQSNPSHIFTSTGNFLVSLTVYTLSGDSAIFQNVIQVYERPQAWFTVIDSACAGADVILNDSSSSISGTIQQWIWNFGDNSGSGSGDTVIHIYNTPGTYSIQLTVTSDLGCMDSSTKNINILPGPFSSFTVANTCIGETAQFNNTSISPGTSIATTFWDFGDGNTSTIINPTHTYSGVAANFQVALISETVNGCRDTNNRDIRIGNKALPWFQISTDTACTFSAIQFTDSSFAGIGDSINSRIWDFGDGTTDSLSLNPIHSYSTSGTFTVQLKVSSPDDCDTIITRTIFIIESPTANFTINNACFGNTHQFNDLSIAPVGSNIISWMWDFGDTNTSSVSSPGHIYSDTGNYNVNLIIQSNIGCYDTLSSVATVYQLPVAFFNNGKACTGIPIQFVDSSNVEGSSITNWNWTITGTGLSSNLQDPQFMFDDPLAYQVELIVSSAQGCLDTTVKLIVTDQSPEFNMIAPDHCFESTAIFQHLPSPGSNSSYSFLWTFGDSTASFLANPAHQYNFTGTYIVELQVSDLNNGCISLKADTAIVYPNPEAAFVNPDICIGQPVPFTDSSTIASGNIQNYYWRLGDAGNSNLQNTTATFTQPGNQNITLITTSTFGCKDSISKTLTVFELPLVSASADPNYGAPPLLVQFNNYSDPGNHLWDFGDGSTLSGSSSLSHVFADTGIYQSTLVVTNNHGCVDSLSLSIYVQIPVRDLSLNGVSFNNVNNRWIMKALVFNMGNEDAHEFVLKAVLNGEGVFYNTFRGDTLRTGQIREFTFNTILDVSQNNPDFFCAEVISQNNLPDMNSSNNRFCISSSNTYEITGTYPNPFNEKLFLGINMIESGEIAIEIFDLAGKSCLNEYTTTIAEGLSTIIVPVNELSSSVYIMKVTFKETEKFIRIIKQ